MALVTQMGFSYYMIDNKDDEERYVNKNTINIRKKWFFPIVVVIIIVPLVMMVHVFQNGIDGNPWFGSDRFSYDIYFYYKALVIKTCGAIVAAIVIGLYLDHKPSFLYEKRSYAPMIALLVYTLLTIISSALSYESWDASFGGIGRFEGCYVILSYVVFFYMTFGYARSIEFIQFLLDALLIGATIISLIGVLEAVGVNIYKYDFLQSIIQMLETSGTSVRTISDNIVSGTLDNPNYVGSYVALVLPYSVYLFIKGKAIWRRILAAVSIDLLGIFLFGSQSDTGMFAVAIGFVIALFFVFPNMGKKSKLIIASLGGVLFIATIAFLMKGDFYKHLFVDKNVYPIENMRTDLNNLIITTSEQKRIRVTMNEKTASESGWSNVDDISNLVSISDDETGIPISVKNDSLYRFHIVDDKYPILEFSLGNLIVPKENSASGKEEVLDVLYINDGKHEFKFSTFLGANICYLYQKDIAKVLLRDVERYGFEGLYDIANGRGYIWACTIPLLKNYIVFGAGQDNYVHVFPNDDYIGKMNAGYDEMYQLKPHNMYLGIWVQQGLIALIAFLFLYALFIIRVIRLCYGKKRVSSSNDFSAKGVAIMTAIGTTCYMVAGVANDSNVGVTPIYWVMLGIGYAAEAICRQNHFESFEK